MQKKSQWKLRSNLKGFWLDLDPMNKWIQLKIYQEGTKRQKQIYYTWQVLIKTAKNENCPQNVKKDIDINQQT